MKYFTHTTTPHQDDSESVVYMPLIVVTVAVEEVGVSIEEVVTEDVEEEVDEVEEETSKEVVEGAATHMKI